MAPKKKDPPPIDLSKMFDLDRSTLTSEMVAEFEDGIEARALAGERIKKTAAVCKEHGFKPVEIRAMKRLAKLRYDDKVDTGEGRDSGPAPRGRINSDGPIRRITRQLKLAVF